MRAQAAAVPLPHGVHVLLHIQTVYIEPTVSCAVA